MKTVQQIVDRFSNNTDCTAQIHAIIPYVPKEFLKQIVPCIHERYLKNHTHVELTYEDVIGKLKHSVETGFRKAKNYNIMGAQNAFAETLLWNWILEEGLENWDKEDFAYYGLPLFSKTAKQYGFANPIGFDTGREDKYK